MTEQEWKRRSIQKIFRAVKKAGRIRVRDLKRATHYNRGPESVSIPVWYEALDHLENTKQVVVERDEGGLEAFIMSRVMAEVLGYDPQGRRIRAAVTG